MPDMKQHLTTREKSLFRQCALGHSDAQIAEQMRVRPNTIGTHISRARAKLGEFERCQIPGLAMALGIVTAEEVIGAAYDWMHANCPDLADLRQGEEQRKQMQARIDAELYAAAPPSSSSGAPARRTS